MPEPPLCSRCNIPFVPLSEHDRQQLALTKEYRWVCPQCYDALTSPDSAPEPLFGQLQVPPPGPKAGANPRSRTCPHCNGHSIVVQPDGWLACEECDFRFTPQTQRVLIVRGPDDEPLVLPVESVKGVAHAGQGHDITISGALPASSECDLWALNEAVGRPRVLVDQQGWPLSPPLEGAVLLPPVPTAEAAESRPEDQSAAADPQLGEPPGSRSAAPPPGTDDNAFRPAREFMGGERFPTYKAIRKHLKAHPEIRTQKPTKQRLEIHAGDWMRSLTVATSDPLDLPAEVVDDAVRQVEERKARIRSSKAQD